jgi:hypothetical protein
MDEGHLMHTGKEVLVKIVIAGRNLFFTTKHGSEKKELVSHIGAPYRDEDGMARCPIEWTGFSEEFAQIVGVDSLQALQPATNVDSVPNRLRNKHDLFWPSGESHFDD